MTSHAPRTPRPNRRELLKLGGLGLGAIAAHELFAGGAIAEGLHHAPRAKRVIHLFMAGAPSQFELFEPKEALQKHDGESPPESLIRGKRFAFIDPSRSKLMGSRRAFARHGECGAPVSELLPHTARIVDKLCFLRGLSTNEINHGSEAADLPGFVVLQSGSRGPRGGAPLWGSGFLSPRHAGTPFRSSGDPVLNLKTPEGISPDEQRQFFDAVNALNRLRAEELADEAIEARIASYELAARMQTSTPELVDLSSEPESVRALYGLKDERPSFARNCLLARRLVERGTRFVQLYHADWDHHGDPNNNLGAPLEARCREVDRASAALVLDLEQRGLLEDTLVLWGGEFGRTPMSEVRVAIGRDHHIDAFTMWLAGGGVRAGHSYGVTDEIGYSVVDEGVHVHDLHATILHLLGIDHLRLTHRFQGRDFRLTDVHGRVVHEILA
jgi:hypothetical protein